jgi:acyl-CoA synthetase (AMP-forming)/AMP-acid ligase II
VPFPDFTPSFPVFLRTLAERFSDRTVLVADGERLTFSEVEARSRALAKGLLADGVSKGTHVGILMPNCVDWVLSWFAVMRIGAVAVPMSTFYQARELAWTLQHADVSLLLSAASFLSNDYGSRLEEGLPSLKEADAVRPLLLREAPFLRGIRIWGSCDRAWARPGAEDLVAQGAAIDEALFEAVEQSVAAADRAFIVYSSGSTAEPKAAIHSHGTAVRHSYNLSESFGIQYDDVLYSPMPFFWVGGVMTGLLMSMHQGGALLTHGSFDPGETLDLIEGERATYLMGWQHYGKSMIEHPSYPGRDLSRIRRSAMLDMLPEELRPEDPLTRTNSLGMTETCGPHTNDDWSIELPAELYGAFGRPLEGVEHKIIDPETGATLAQGEPGEICVRGYSLMQGMYKREREQVFDADGYYHTGDGGYFNEDGWLFFTGRLGDMIKTGGANVTPAEVEAVLMAYDDVSEAYVTGIPDADRGQLVAAAVVPSGGTPPDAESLRGRLKSDLSAFKVPRHIWVCDKAELPFTDSGKLKKPALAELLAERARRA